MNILLTLIGFLALSPLASASQPEQSWTVGQYKIESSHAPTGDQRLAIVKDGQELYSKTVGQYWFVTVSGKKGNSSHEPVATDVTGDGKPDLIIEHFPRNSQCCWSYSIVTLGPAVKEIATVSGFPSPMTMEDVNGDGVYEITGDDWAFYSWYASPRIILRFDKGKYELATNLMRRPAPAESELASKAADFRKATVYAGFNVAPEVYRYMLDLIYSGNMDTAWAFLDRVWSKQKAGKEEFVETFREQLAKSRFWPEIREMSRIRMTVTSN
jgi:hypothetical protein